MTTPETLPIPEAPFRGIEAFRFIDQQIFAERDDEIWDLQSNITRYRAVLLYGESGTGKSSLINAGLIPAAKKKKLIADRIRLQPTLGEELIIERISVTSDARPPYLPSNFVLDEGASRVVLSVGKFLERLESLSKSAPKSEATVSEDFSFTPHPRPLLIFDQFEELVTLFEPSNIAVAENADPTSGVDARKKALAKIQEVQNGIIDLLVRLVQDDTLRIKVLFVFREDYLAKLNNLFKRVPDLLDQYLRLLPPNPEVVTRIIRAPFERLPGVFVKRKPDGIGSEISQSLAEKIRDKFIERSGGGSLNLSELEIVCRRLWESQNPDSLFAQKEISGVLEDYFSEKLAAFPSELQDPAIALLGLMITSANTRNIISEADLFSRVQREEEVDLDKANKAADLLLGTRLVWRELRNGVYFYTIASDYLAKWIAFKKAERTAERDRRKLAQQAELIKRTQADETGAGADTATKAVGFDQRTFIKRVQSADADEVSEIIARASPNEEKSLRAYFGDARYQLLHSYALQKRPPSAKGNVVIIPGLMGSELSVFASSGGTATGDMLWLNAMRIAMGRFSWLKLNEDGNSGEYDVRPTGVMKRQYGELMLALAENWNVRTFAFDWRKDINLAAVELGSKIQSWFGNQPVHIVAHEMGGLVARAFISKYPKPWESLWDDKSGVPGRRGGRLIMLGTPNHGTYATVQLITGLHSIVKNLSLIDLRHSLEDLLGVFNSFVGPYQMLPSPLVDPEAAQLYESSTYGKLNVPQNRLDSAHKCHSSLQEVVDPKRMICIAGDKQQTFSRIKNYLKIGALESYEVTTAGDGVVPHTLSQLRDPQGVYVPTYFVEATNASLPANPNILGALNGLLESGQTNDLPEIQRTSKKLSASDQKAALEQVNISQSNLNKQLSQLSQQVRTLATDATQVTTFSSEELKLEELITFGPPTESTKKSLAAPAALVSEVEVPSIEVGLVYDQIASINYGRILSTTGDPVDSIAVGHYIGVLPQGPELWLDKMISTEKTGKAALADKVSKEKLLLTQYTQWGIIHGELGRPFFLNDPRTTRLRNPLKQRLIAIAGMGQPGRFGAPELVVLSRNLCWSLGRIGKRHLETVVIGTGLGNITFDEAVAAWMQGIRLALIRAPNERQRLRRVTFVESDPERITFIQEAILGQRTQLAEAPAGGLRIKYKEIPRPTLDRIARDARTQARLKLREERKSVATRRKVLSSDLAYALPPIHVSIRFEGKSYRISAITERLALPEREISIDNAIVDAATKELAGSDSPTKQLEVARFLRELLIPADLGYFLTHDGPVNLTLDKTAAQIPWEMIAEPENTSSLNLRPGTAGDGFLHSDKYLGTRRGVTRQLPFMSSLLPDPPPPARKVLRVLVVGDPAEDARLPGAEAEGVEVASIFESFNSTYGPESPNRVEVIKLLGPLEASRTAVLRELMIRNYDVLHFAGHCVYDALDPTASGWLFSKGTRLSPKELNRIDKIPRFVFSNAFGGTDSGNVLPVVSFAETFLARGVGNFIYPAWPVDDVSARQFALKLYAGLLGLKPKAKGTGYEPAERQPLNMAVCEARLAVAAMPSGLKSWGAYQHYGSREFSFFAKK